MKKLQLLLLLAAGSICTINASDAKADTKAKAVTTTVKEAPKEDDVAAPAKKVTAPAPIKKDSVVAPVKKAIIPIAAISKTKDLVKTATDKKANLKANVKKAVVATKVAAPVKKDKDETKKPDVKSTAPAKKDSKVIVKPVVTKKASTPIKKDKDSAKKDKNSAKKIDKKPIVEAQNSTKKSDDTSVVTAKKAAPLKVKKTPKAPKNNNPSLLEGMADMLRGIIEFISAIFYNIQTVMQSLSASFQAALGV